MTRAGNGVASTPPTLRMRLGLAGEIIPRDPGAVTPQYAAGLAKLGIGVIVTHFPISESLSQASLRLARQSLAGQGLAIAQAAGVNANLVVPDQAEEALRRLRMGFATARLLGAESVLTGCGSWHPQLFYGPDPRNHRPRSREHLIRMLRAAAPLAEEAGMPLVLECHLLTTLDTPAHIRAVLAAVGSPWIRANFDPVNLIGTLPDLYHSARAIRRMGAILAAHYAPGAHFKDIAPGPNLVLQLLEVPPGEGLLRYDAFFEVCRMIGDRSALIIEHLPEARVPAALAFARRMAAAHRIEFL